MKMITTNFITPLLAGIITSSFSLPAFSQQNVQTLHTDGNNSSCFAYGANRESAHSAFLQQCGSTPTSCEVHRNQTICSGASLSVRDIALPLYIMANQNESPFVDGLSVTAQWNELALAAVRSGPAKPTVTAYQLFMVSTAMYDAYSSYSSQAMAVHLDRALKRPASEHNTSNEIEAISQAAYKALVFLFPKFENRYGYFYQYLTELGFKPVSGYATNEAVVSTPSGIGYSAAAQYVDDRAFDGSGFKNNYKESPTLVYPDAYVPVNSPDANAITGEYGTDFDPNHWQPLRVPNGTLVDGNDNPVIDSLNLDSFGDQQFLSPHWGGVTPFALTHGAEFRPSPPPLYGSDASYVDALGVESTNTDAYVAQLRQVIDYSANLDDRTKLMAEFWADGPRTESPPGHWNQLTHGIIERDNLPLSESVKLLFALNAALLDASIATWEAKRHYDYIRPASAIRWLFQGEYIQAWAGPNMDAQMIRGETWSPYQQLDFVTPPFPEYVSGHSTFSRAAAEVLTGYLGSGQFYDGNTRTLQDVNGDGKRDMLGQHIALPGDFLIEDGPANSVVFTWPTFIDAADEAGISRLHGGIHIQDGDLRGRELGIKIGRRVLEKANGFFNGTANPEDS